MSWHISAAGERGWVSAQIEEQKRVQATRYAPRHAAELDLAMSVIGLLASRTTGSRIQVEASGNDGDADNAFKVSVKRIP